MSRARRAEKTNSKVWIPVVCIVAVIIIVCIIVKVSNKNEENGTENTVQAQDEIKNVENEIEENTVEENIVEENTAQNDVQDETTNQTADTSEEDSSATITTTTELPSAPPAQPAETDQKQKAIELVKKEWGEDDTVNYVFDYINENGEYVIAVKDKTSATVKNYFRVNLETGAVELD